MRVFSEAEIAQILQRAADRQAEARQIAPDAGLTLEELEALAAEAGLDVAHVRAAAAEIAPASRAERSRSATHVFVERTVETPLTDAGWDEVVGELRNRFGKAGIAAFTSGAAPAGDVAVSGRAREWSHTDGLGVETRVFVTERGSATRLRLSQRVGVMGQTAEAILYGLPLGLLGGLVAMKMLPGPNVLLMLVTVVLAVAAVLKLDGLWRTKMHGRLEGLSGDLAGILSAHGVPEAASARAAQATAAVPETPARPRLSLDGLGDAPDAPPSLDRRPSANRSGA